MPRLRNIQTGAVVSVSDETAALLDGEWEPAEKAAPKAPAPAKRAVRKPATKTVAKKAAASKTEK
jgi:transcription elongation factor